MSSYDLLPDAVLRLDVERRIVEANDAAVTLTGYPRATLIGQSCEVLGPRSKGGHPLLHGDWHPSARLRSVATLPEQEVSVVQADGGRVKVNVAGRYQRGDRGRLEGVVLSLRLAEARRHQSATGIEIVSTVSHELRSPLTSVKGYTSLLLNRWDRLRDDQKRMMLEQVNHDADRVTRLITELLDISRLESGRLVLRRKMVDLPGLSRTVVEKVRMEYPDLDCVLDFPTAFPTVYADEDKVVQVLTNLVENACKYASPVGLRVEGNISETLASVAVVDKGEGFPERDLARVFTKFFRRAETKPNGTGLGLWISRGLVEAHGGQLDVTSIPGEGSTFRFTLPLYTFEELHG
ncbi:MAG: sensor histidine kinase [Acidimicrobiales bacterium]